MLAKEQMFEVYANFDFFWEGAGKCLGGGAHPPENPPLVPPFNVVNIFELF